MMAPPLDVTIKFCATYEWDVNSMLIINYFSYRRMATKLNLFVADYMEDSSGTI
jgi:hypothetical protein